MNKIDTILFDLGGVLIDWNPRYVYEKLWPNDEDTYNYFIENIFKYEDNLALDAGTPFAEKVNELTALHPDWAEAIGCWDSRWQNMLGDEVELSASILRKLHSADHYRLFALTNWSAEKFPIARERFDFLDKCFANIIVSGEIKLIKPQPEIFLYTIEKLALSPKNTLFIDDSAANIATAQTLGFQTIHFIDSQQMLAEMRQLQIDI